MTSDASHAEIDLLRRLHRGVRVQLTALKQLPERSPEDDLRLRAAMRLEQRLMDRIGAMNDNASVGWTKPPPGMPMLVPDAIPEGSALAAE
jgi:hypothetical protein